MADWAWQKNLRDAVLLDPLVLVHGNVKDLFLVGTHVRTRLPARLVDPPYVTFDLWLATELEELGFPVVILYDPIDGAVALRASMADAFDKLASQRPSSETPSSAAEATTPPSEPPTTPKAPALPKSSAATTTPSQSDWMVRLKTAPNAGGVFPNPVRQRASAVRNPGRCGLPLHGSLPELF